MAKISDTVYKKTVLENGIRVVTEKMPQVRSISIGVWLTVGSRDENLSNNGISHFIEHMLFKGTTSRNTRQIAESLESLGGHLDAFTSKELSCYGAQVLDEHLPEAVDILSDILLHSLFDEQEIAKEKEVILKEIIYSQDTPDERVFDHFYQNVFPSHPLGYLIYGSKENVLAFKREDALTYMNQHYTPSRIVVAAAGNINHNELVNLVERNFKELPESKPRTLVEITEHEKKNLVIEDNCSQAHICIGTRAYSYTNPRKFGLLVIHTLLGGGMSSRLFQNIREKYGLAYAIFSFKDFFIDTGLFGVYVATDIKKIDLSLELIKKEFHRMKTDYVNPEELDRVKSQLKGNLMLALESTVSRMTRLANMEIYLDRYYTLDDVIKDIDNVTAEQIIEIGNELFQEDRFFTTILMPNKV